MILQRYIAWNLTKGWVLVLLVLGSIFGLISFIGELDRTTGDYDTLAVAVYSLSILPQSLVELAPVMQPIGAVHPELDPPWCKRETRPMRRTRDFACILAGILHIFDPLHIGRARIERTRLIAGCRTDLADKWA